MARMIEFTCDGCGDEKTVPLGKEKPADWKDVRISWTGFVGYPTSREDGSAEYDLCPRCAQQLRDSINPRMWPRANHNQIDEAEHG